METRPILEQNTPVNTAEMGRVRGWEPSAIAGDIATLGFGAALAAVFNTLLIFLLPRLMSIEEYGYWRLFLLYAGYVGFLHFGFADGALLRWAGKSRDIVYPEVGVSWKYLLLQHLFVILPLSLAAMFVPGLPRNIRILCMAVLLFSLVMNSVTLLQYSLQGIRKFLPVAVATALPPGAFVTLAFLWSLRKTPTAGELMALYGTAWLIALIYLRSQVKPVGANSSISLWTFGKALTTIGWPVLLANTGFGLVQSADRLVVSSFLPISEFAQYSLAASTMFVPLTAIAAIARAFFTHAAAVEHEDRVKIYSHMSRFLVVAWSLLLPYFFLLEAFVKRFLSKYAPALPVAGILILSLVFLAEIQILHTSYFYLNGKQREFLSMTVVALALGITIALALTKWLHSLPAVAIGQTASLAFWWLTNEWMLKDISRRSWKDWLGTFAVFLWSSASYWIALHGTTQLGWRIIAYYLLVFCVLWISSADTFRLGWKFLHQNDRLQYF